MERRVERVTDLSVTDRIDCAIAEGNIGVWNVVGKNPEEMMRFSVGKYDPTNPRHLWILDQLGITDADLKKLGQ